MPNYRLIMQAEVEIHTGDTLIFTPSIEYLTHSDCLWVSFCKARAGESCTIIDVINPVAQLRTGNPFRDAELFLNYLKKTALIVQFKDGYERRIGISHFTFPERVFA